MYWIGLTVGGAGHVYNPPTGKTMCGLEVYPTDEVKTIPFNDRELCLHCEEQANGRVSALRSRLPL